MATSTPDDNNTDTQNDSRRPYSIDLTLELEHQLDNDNDNDSLPPSTPDGNRPHSLDPQVLAHIITELRTSLQEVTRQRDELIHTLSERQAKEKDLSDTLAHITDKCSKLQEELDTASNKAKEDEHTISLLRTKVEESRRGLMRLQSESRRQSQGPSGLDLSRASFASFTSPPSSKRASFAPLIGTNINAGRMNAHRRISSVSDSGFISGFGSPSAGHASFTLSDNAMQPTVRSARSSGLFGRASPPPSIFQSEESVEVEMLRKELNAMRAELDETKHELNETNEAREASELCVKALRSFIEENNVGAQIPSTRESIPMPLASSQAEQRNNPAAGGWGFNFWRTQNIPLASPAVPPPPMSNSISSPPPQPITRKLGEFFGTRSASISSTTPVKSPRSELEAMFNGLSDTSSIEESLVEPVSPASELPRTNVLVKDTTSVTSGSSARDLGTSPERKGDGLPSPSEGVFTPVAI